MAKIIVAFLLMTVIGSVQEQEERTYLSLSNDSNIIVPNPDYMVDYAPRSESVSLALENPGKEVAVATNTELKYKKLDFWYTAPIYKFCETVIFKNGKLMTNKEGVIVKGAAQFNGYKCICICVTIFATIFIVCFVNNIDNPSLYILYVITIGLSFLTAFAACDFAIKSVIVEGLVTFVCLLAVPAVATSDMNKSYKQYTCWALSVVFYIAAGAIIFV